MQNIDSSQKPRLHNLYHAHYCGRICGVRYVAIIKQNVHGVIHAIALKTATVPRPATPIYANISNVQNVGWRVYAKNRASTRIDIRLCNRAIVRDACAAGRVLRVVTHSAITNDLNKTADKDTRAVLHPGQSEDGLSAYVNAYKIRVQVWNAPI